MALRVKEDLVRGAGAGYSLNDQVIVRVFQVSGLGAYNPNARVAQAMFSIDSVDPTIRIPSMTQSHPDPALVNFVVVDIRVGPDVTWDVMDVFVTYRYRLFAGGYLKSFGGSLVNKPFVLRHADGSPVELLYTPTGSTTSMAGTFIYDRLLVNGNFSFKTLERIDPEYLNANYAGSVNWRTWRGYPPRTVMLLPIMGNTEDNIWFHNLYTFNFRFDTHDQYVFYRRQDGSVPIEVAKDVTDDGTLFGNGWQRVPPEWQVDFAALLPWIPNVAPSDYGVPRDAVLHRWGV